ncbi:MAG: pyruvate kinase [Planctomycetota bacterium]
MSTETGSTPSLLNLPRTKLVATVGPASREPETLRKLITAGVDVFRLNMAHADLTVHQESVDRIRAASAACDRTVGILVDLAGPKIRLGQLHTDPLELHAGDHVDFVRGDQPAAAHELTCGYAPLLDEVQIGDEIALADGIARLSVVSKTKDRATCRVVDSGTIRSRQGVNLPGTKLSVPALLPVDRKNAEWAARAGVDYISLSFVRTPDEVRDLKQLVRAAGSPAQIVAKIEKREALDNLEAIVAQADTVMVARGDLGVEIAIEKTPLAQKRIIRTCLQLGKPVIVATQMLESMHHSKQPTRAEVSDVANAILDGADACMLSGETAIGEFPIDAVRMMKKIMGETEQMLRYRSSRMSSKESESGWSVLDSVMLGAAQIARRLDARRVVIASSTPDAALVKSKQRDFVATVCLSEKEEAARQMSLYWGIIPLVAPQKFGYGELPRFVIAWAQERAQLRSGERIVIVMDNEFLPDVHDTVMVVEVP